MAKLGIKSKFGAEFRRISLPKTDVGSYEHFRALIQRLHKLIGVPFELSYVDPKRRDLLPINNDDNLGRAVLTSNPLLRIIIQRKGESIEKCNGYGTYRPCNIMFTIFNSTPCKAKHFCTSNPQDFQQESAIIDVVKVPKTCRRVHLRKHDSERPLGFYIRDGTSVQVSVSGVKKVPGIFISRLVPDGLAESTGLLAVNDEIIEVNGIKVVDKTLDQVTDMVIANSHNLIITIQSDNQRATISVPHQGSLSRTLQQTAHSAATTVNTSEDNDQDEVVDFCSLEPKAHK